MRIGGGDKSNYAEAVKILQALQSNKKHGLAKKSRDASKNAVEGQAQDTIDISAEAKQRAVEPQNEQKHEQKYTSGEFQMLLEQLENSLKQGEAVGESMEVRIKCLKIAMRILSGDKVPKEDERYLMKYDMDLYMKAVMMKQEKENPKEHKRLSEDEKTGDDTEASGQVSADAPLPSAESQPAQGADATADAPAEPEA